MALRDIVLREIGRFLISRKCISWGWSSDFRLYDQGQLMQVYLDGYLLSKNPLLLATVEDIAEYLIHDALAHEDGGFYSAEDADSLPTENSHERKGIRSLFPIANYRGSFLCLDSEGI
jgi:hypothetical protein